MALAILLACPAVAQARCDDIIPAAAPAGGAGRPITAADLIGLRDIGDPDSASYGGAGPFAVSPDGRRVAYIINHADLATNGYCRALVVNELQKAGPPTVLDRGGELIKILDVQRGFYLPSGATQTIVPAWSPDGRALAYLRRDNGVTQAWLANADGSGARAVSRSSIDISAIGWSADGRRLLFGSRRGGAAADAALDREGQTGWLYDGRISPEISPRPMTQATDELDVLAVEVRSGRTMTTDSADRAALQAAVAPGLPADSVAVAADGRRAWAERADSSPLAPARLMATGRHGETVHCTAAECAGGILSIWWDGDAVLFLRREGWDKGDTALYRWSIDAGPPVPVLRTDDVLHGCTKAIAVLVCTRENSTTPRRVVTIDVKTGAVRELFDPNPEFAGIRLGQVVRLRWRNDLGLEAWGDLVLPPDYRPGTKLPMVVVQYHSDGFLRGGTGDDYPIYLFAQRGFAVLSTERPTFFAAAFPKLKTWYDINAANQKNWGERRSLLSSVLTGVRLAVDRGFADPARVGITGLSDGASTAAFALINTRAFAAAAMSTCCMEPNTTATYGGIAWADWLRGMGYPPATANDRTFWRETSLAQNAARIDTPLLLQLADNEFRLALEAFGALREQRKPVEMYVYPDEYHVKWQPEHRRAVYERNLDWFSFWLQHQEDSDPAKAAQYVRWRALRSPARNVPPPRPTR